MRFFVLILIPALLACSILTRQSYQLAEPLPEGSFLVEFTLELSNTSERLQLLGVAERKEESAVLYLQNSFGLSEARIEVTGREAIEHSHRKGDSPFADVRYSEFAVTALSKYLQSQSESCEQETSEQGMYIFEVYPCEQKVIVRTVSSTPFEAIFHFQKS